MDWFLAEDSDGGYHDFTDEEIVTLVLEEDKDNGDDDDDDEEESLPAVSRAQVFSALERVLVYPRATWTPYEHNCSVMLKSLLIETEKKRKIYQAEANKNY